ncbi:MAG: hypothetical protein OEM46_00155 [Ignavibacteria bacterium]|nr:hypothetical protein [Ignavibacteria bacterium]
MPKGLKSTNSIWLRLFLIFLSISAVVVGLIIGLEIFEALGEFKKLGIIIIFGSILGAVLLLASVKILNDLAYIKNRLDKKDEKPL